MKQVAYLLGAGASAGPNGSCLPVSGKIADSLASLPDAVRMNVMSGTGEVSLRPPPEGSTGGELMAGLSYLRNIAQTHPSLDTYARKIYLRNGPDDEREIRRFKAAVSCYFILLQALTKLDPRYDHFFASVLNPVESGKPILPADISLLSWNYDTQLEKSFRDFTTSPDYVFEGLSSNVRVLRLNGVCISTDAGMKDFRHLCFEKFDAHTTLAQIDRLYNLFLMKAAE